MIHIYPGWPPGNKMKRTNSKLSKLDNLQRIMLSTKKKRKFSKMLHILWSIDMIFNKWTKLKKWRAGDWLPGIRETRRREVGVAVKRQHEWFSWWRKWSVSCLHQFQYSGCGLLLQSYKLSPFEENLVKNTESKDHPQSLCIMNVNTNLQLSQNNKFH